MEKNEDPPVRSFSQRLGIEGEPPVADRHKYRVRWYLFWPSSQAFQHDSNQDDDPAASSKD
jgi:hypothetical protein